jgi:hypothetical protein
MTYSELKAQQQKAINDFPIFFAFNNEQLETGLKKLNTTKEEIRSIGSGGFVRKTDQEALVKLSMEQHNAINNAMLDDDFLISAITYELGNHEFCITYDPTDTIEALGLDLTDARVRSCFKKARKEYLASCEG